MPNVFAEESEGALLSKKVADATLWASGQASFTYRGSKFFTRDYPGSFGVNYDRRLKRLHSPYQAHGR